MSRPLASPRCAFATLLYSDSYVPGVMALAQSLFGRANRWGKMPYTVYKSSWASQHSMLDHDVTHGRTYRYGADAVVPFGWGQSLTNFTLDFEGGQPDTLTELLRILGIQ